VVAIHDVVVGEYDLCVDEVIVGQSVFASE